MKNHNLDWIMKQALGPGCNGNKFRKALSNDEFPTISFPEENTRLPIIVNNGYACLMQGDRILSKVPFVPWGILDEQYLEKLEDGALLAPNCNDFLKQYYDRFPSNVWE